MSLPFVIQTLLSDRHWRAFNAFAADRRCTIDAAHAWLRKRGYRVSRGAVWNFVKRLREQSLATLQSSLGTLREADLRRHVKRAAGHLSGDALRSLALMAAALDAQPWPTPTNRKTPQPSTPSKPSPPPSRRGRKGRSNGG